MQLRRYSLVLHNEHMFNIWLHVDILICSFPLSFGLLFVLVAYFGLLLSLAHGNLSQLPFRNKLGLCSCRFNTLPVFSLLHFVLFDSYALSIHVLSQSLFQEF
jgi:hypothetical protein